MPKSREKTRANKKIYAALNKANEYGVNDPTPYKAVNQIRRKILRGKEGQE